MIGWSSNPRIPNRHAWHKRLVTGFEVSFVLRMEKDISLIPLQAIVCSLFRIEDWSQNSHTAREIMSIMCIFYSASSSQKKTLSKEESSLNAPSIYHHEILHGYISVVCLVEEIQRLSCKCSPAQISQPPSTSILPSVHVGKLMKIDGKGPDS